MVNVDPFLGEGRFRLVAEIVLPEAGNDDEKARYFNLGKSVSDRGIFTIFWTDGKRYRAILSRDMTPEERARYAERRSSLKEELTAVLTAGASH